MPRICDTENLYLAYWKARKGKEAKHEVVLFASNLDDRICEIKNKIERGTIGGFVYNRFKIFDPKERLICAAPFEQRVLQHAIMNICGPIFDSKLIDDCFASRLGKGTYAALARAQAFHRKYRYCVKLDIRKYFDSIDHTVLKTELRRIFKEKCLLNIFDEIIDGYHTQNGKGVPIGNLTSQYFANHYLSGLDHYAKECLKISGYVRYMDDMLVYGNDKSSLVLAAKSLREYLSTRLLLGLKVFDVRKTRQTTQFLGYRLTKNALLLSDRSKRRYRQKIHRYHRLLEYGIWDESALVRHLYPLTAFVQKARCLVFRQRIVKETEKYVPI